MSEGTASARRAEPRSGTVIADRYRIDRLIARGGMAAVYLAEHTKLHRPVALKLLSPPPDVDETESFEERFALEAKTVASLDHRNIVAVHDFGETDDARFFLAMEYIDGPRLTDILRDGPLPWQRALALLLQVCAALQYAHKRGVIHRDLKPSNLLIRTDDRGEELVKVVDFGLVKLTETDQSITRAGLILGSPHCMAPEQVKGVEVDHRADVYAVGILLFRSLTGHYPFHGGNSAATMVAHLNEPIPAFEQVTPGLDLPGGLEAIVRRCLAKEPQARYPDMQTLGEELAAISGAPEAYRTFATFTQSSIQRESVAPPSNNTARTALVAVVGAGVVAVLVVAALGGGFLLAAATGNRGVTEPRPAAAIEAAPEPVAAAIEATAPAPSAGEELAPPGAEAATEPTDPPAPSASGEAEAAPVEPAAPRPAANPKRPAKATRADAGEAAKPAPEAADPVAEPTTAPPEAKTDAAPEGYMGLPEDLF